MYSRAIKSRKQYRTKTGSYLGHGKLRSTNNQDATYRVKPPMTIEGFHIIQIKTYLKGSSESLDRTSKRLDSIEKTAKEISKAYKKYSSK